MIPRLLLLLGSASIAFIVAADIRWARQDSRSYELAHRTTVGQHVERSFRVVTIACLGVVVAVVAILDRKRRRFWDVVVVTLLAGGIASALAGCFAWWRSGFDH